jgi:hypothetical protein
MVTSIAPIGEHTVMKPCETSAAVADDGEFRILGIPFGTGIQVTVKLTPAKKGAQPFKRSRDLERFLAAVLKSPNTESVDSMNRSELDDRDVVPDILFDAASNVRVTTF